MRQSLYVCNHAGWHLLEAVCQCVTCVSSVDFFAPALPAQLFLSQHFCVFAPVFLGHSLAVWVALALPNMPPKARAPEARMVFGWGQVSGVEICTCSGPSRCLPTVCKKLRKECLYIYIYIFFSSTWICPRFMLQPESIPCCTWEPRTQLLCAPLLWPNASSKCFKVNVDFHKSKKFTNGWGPQSLLSWTDN